MSSTHSSTHTSSRIGPYRLSRTLGIGAFSKVKMAIHEPTKKKVAIKILNRKKLSHMDLGHKLWREINILREFSHPHINRLYEVIDTPSDIFVVVEYVPGGELFDYIVSRGRLEEPEARLFFQQIISGVDYCHHNKVVHRDLKPENILLDDHHQLKIADFGLSNLLVDGCFLRTSCGSPNYAAPEVISGSLYSGPEVDVWSCGVILYALLCGTLPFDDENIPSLFRKIKSGAYALPAYLSPEARDLIPRMLRVDPISRISLAEVRRHPFFCIELPGYLVDEFEDWKLGVENGVEATELDWEVVREVAALKEHMGHSVEEVREAVEFGPDLLTSWECPERKRLRGLAVSYNILVDDKRRRLQKKKCVSTPADVQLELSDRGMSKNKSRSNNKKEFPDGQLSFVKMGDGLKLDPSKRLCWAVGLHSGKCPSEVMGVLFSVLKGMGGKWRLFTPYHLQLSVFRACPTQKYPTGNGRVKANLQLYEHLDKERNVHTQLLDIHRIAGNMYCFMDICSVLLARMEERLGRHVDASNTMNSTTASSSNQSIPVVPNRT